jgi:hypothetical protein
LVDVSAGTTNRLLYTSFTASNISNLILVDRIGHMGGMSGTVATAQSTGASMTTPIASGRCASTGSDVLWCLEWYTATGATPVTATISYTNQSGASGKTTTLSLPATVPAYRVYPVTVLAAGDTSILTIDSITLSGTTGTAGSFGVTAYKILQQTCIPVANTSINTDWAGLAMPLVTPQVCFSTLQYCTAVTYGTINYQVVVGTH